MTKRNLVWAVLILVAAVILVLARKPVSPPPSPDAPRPPLEPLIETYRLIKEKGYHPSDDQELIRGAVGGMAGAADEYSTYIPPDKAESFQRRLEGMERGVGLKLEQVGGQLRVHQVMFGSPAYRASLNSGDVVLAIDGQTAEGMTAAAAERLVNDGPIDSTVRLEVAAADDRVHTVEIRRQEFRVESVTGLLRGDNGQWNYLVSKDPPIACLRIREFVRDTAQEVQLALRQVETMQGLVLDLRDNPGGQLPTATEVADLFLRGGSIVTLVDRSGKGRPRMARPEGTYPEDLRLVVLINGQTASAAEIVAGALAIHHRAVLVGTRTRGKGTIQSLFRLPDDMGEMSLTTSEFLLGDSQSIYRRKGSDAWGIDPHVEVILSPLERYELARLQSRLEAVPSPHAVAATHRADRRTRATRPAATSTASAPAGPEEILLTLDGQLRKAVELLSNPQEFDALLHPPPTAVEK